MATAILCIIAFTLGVFIGGLGALHCVRFGVLASKEVQTGTTGLVIPEDGAEEFEELDKEDIQEVKI